jgi:hypothetical protein
MDMRGCGAGIRLARGVFHADRSRDLLAVSHWVSERYPHAAMMLVGFSLGANLTLKLLGKFALQLPAGIDAAIAVQPPIDLAYCCQHLSDGLGWVYDVYFARQLWRDFCQRRSWIEGAARVHTPRNPGTLLKFDEQVTAPLAGFPTAAMYYATASAKDVLAAIRIPTLVVAAADDPIVPPAIFREDASWSQSTQMFMVPGGGHLGFVARGRNRHAAPEYWLDAQIAKWVDEATHRV